MSDQSANLPVLDELFPAGSRILLTGTGKQFIERIGIETVRNVILNVMMGENIRTQTEPLTRQRIAQVCGGLVALFARGQLEHKNFAENLSQIALQQIIAPMKRGRSSTWLAQWLLGLTGKSVQNVLRSDVDQLTAYTLGFERAIHQAAQQCRADIGDIHMILGFAEDDQGRQVQLDWQDITRLTTAIGAATLTIRGSDKSMFGKLFERLILGSFISLLGFERVHPTTNTKTENIFWLSDSSDLRESDATLILRPGKVARFDIGFIGSGNSEISKDKLSRYGREFEINQGRHTSTTFIIVDRLPKTDKTKKAAEQIGAEIVQMSMQYWPRELARLIGSRFGFQHELQTLEDQDMRDYLHQKLSTIQIQNFLSNIPIQDLAETSTTSEEEL